VSPRLVSTLRLLIACAAVVLGCGGKVVFVGDDDDPQGGSSANGSQGGFSADGGAPQTNAGGSITTGVPATECQIGCTTLFQCGFSTDSNGAVLCPGFEPSDQVNFVDFCENECAQSMVVLSLIDPDDCEGTIDTISTASFEFSNLCELGL
jgi:hypothetical protein